MSTAGRPAATRRLLAFAGASLIALHAPLQAYAVCRVVEPLGERGGIVFDPNTLVLYVLATDQPIGSECVADPSQDDMDAGAENVAPARPRWGPLDAGTSGHAGAGAESCPPGTRPTERRGSVVHMVVQPSVLSEGRAGLIMPVPARPDVHAANRDLFTTLRERLQPRVVEKVIEVEDESLGYQCRDPKFRGSSGGGCGGGSENEYDEGDPGDRLNDFFDPHGADDPLQRVMIGDGEVSFTHALSTLDYDVTLVSATSADALTAWLDEHEYAHDADDDAAFAAYVDEGAWFVALDVHPHGTRDLEPLVVSWAGDSIPLMHRLQYDPDGGELRTTVFVLAPARMDALDGTARTLYAAPAGFSGGLRGFGLSRGWITQLELVRDTARNLPDSNFGGVLSVEERPVLEENVRVRIPSSKCPPEGDGCGCRLGGHGGERLAATLWPTALVLLWVASRRRRRDR